jgi:hypothetical protein
VRDLTCFALKMENFVKSGKVRRTLSFSWIRRFWPMKCLCNLYCTYVWLERIHGIGNWTRLLGFGLGAQLFSILWFLRRTWLKMIIEGQLLMNPLWLDWYDYEMMYEWLLGDEYDVCDHMLWLFFYLECKELCGDMNYMI